MHWVLDSINNELDNTTERANKYLSRASSPEQMESYTSYLVDEVDKVNNALKNIPPYIKANFSEQVTALQSDIDSLLNLLTWIQKDLQNENRENPIDEEQEIKTNKYESQRAWELSEWIEKTRQEKILKLQKKYPDAEITLNTKWYTNRNWDKYDFSVLPLLANNPKLRPRSWVDLIFQEDWTLQSFDWTWNQHWYDWLTLWEIEYNLNAYEEAKEIRSLYRELIQNDNNEFWKFLRYFYPGRNDMFERREENSKILPDDKKMVKMMLDFWITKENINIIKGNKFTTDNGSTYNIKWIWIKSQKEPLIIFPEEKWLTHEQITTRVLQNNTM